MQRSVHKKYVAIMLMCGFVFGIAIYLSTWVAKAAGCHLLEEPASYMAYCSDPRYGDYEHMAYALELVPAAVQSLKKAQVVMLGNSRTQVAFSTRQIDDFFRGQSISYHVLGFGYGETAEFPAYLFRKYQITPRVVIINTDPFFTDGLTIPAQNSVDAGPQVWADAMMKTAFGHVHGLLCRIFNHICRRNSGSIYRSPQTGQWLWHGYGTYDPRQFLDGAEILPGNGTEKVDLKQSHDVATRILSAFNVPKSCIILTAVPTPAINADQIASALAADFGLPVVLPKVVGMRSADASHLTTASALKWSDAFLSDSAAIIQQCLARP